MPEGDFSTPTFVLYINNSRISGERESEIKEIIIIDKLNAPSTFSIHASDPDKEWREKDDYFIGSKIKILMGYKDGISEVMIGEIASGTLDAGILWGPVGGYYASRAGVPLTVVPLVKESTGPVTFYGITMGVRPNEPQFKHEINKVLAENADEIATILQEYDVPVLDQEGGIVAPGKSGAGQ